MRAFIIRPFGVKNDIDFDEVERLLIAPALKAIGAEGGTTIDIVEAGNIRVDMFRRLLTADLVVADLSIHNANVFYELGIRHALRDHGTFLLRCNADAYPFDIQTDRYFVYKKENPGASLDALVVALQSTKDASEKNSAAKDSPVFMSLPNLRQPDPSLFNPVPQDFGEEVERAKATMQRGDLELLAAEARGFEWEDEGLRLVGRALFSLKAFESARATWEAVRKLNALDAEANTLLATIYQRLGDLTRSDLSLKRVLSQSKLDRNTRAELHSLMGRNAKSRWMDEWRQAESLEQRQERALRSSYLQQSFEAYAAAFNEDLNHFYSGLNALAMLTITIELAQRSPDFFAERFDDDEEAERELASLKEQAARLSASVEVSLMATADRLKREETEDVWVDISMADLRLLTLNRPPKVAHAYQKALAIAPDFAVDAVRNQLSLYQELGLLEENVAAVLRVVGGAPDGQRGPSRAEPAVRPRVLLFTGHMIDAPDRPRPRFPPTKVEVAKREIAKAIAREQEAPGGIAYGVAGCASGSDILFNQVCEEAGIPTRIFLALPREIYKRESVAPGGPEWVKEFERLTETHPVRVLSESKELPGWLREKPDYNIWQRNNLWTLHNALAEAGGNNVTLIALWDGRAGDGPGGTGDMVEEAQARGAEIVILDTNVIFEQ